MIQGYFRAGLLAMILLIAAGCQIGAAPLTPTQLQDYLQTYNIHPQMVEDVGDVTVILFKTPKKLGCYIVWARSGIEATHNADYLSGSQQSSIPQPVTAIYDSAFGSDIICVTINDQFIRKQATSLKIIFADGSEIIVPVKNHGDMIISRNSNLHSSRIDLIIYDQNKLELTRIVF